MVNMRIAIAGYGAEGKSSYAYWHNPENELVIVDEREIPAGDVPLDANVITGEGVFEKLNGFDVVVRTASLAPRKIRTDGTIWSGTNEFFARCAEKSVPIIGVTGTKGKGTTSSLIASILKAAGKTVHLVGNIGQPALEVLPSIQPEDIVVYELSSFQLWDLATSPQVAVVLMIEPDHLDTHADFDDYMTAKSQIAVNQLTTDRVVYNAANVYATKIAQFSPGQRLPYPSEHTAHVRGGLFYYGETELCDEDNLLLPGRHNLENALAAITATWPWVKEPSIIAEGLRSFAGLPHRLELVRELDGVQYYNDSFSSAAGAAVAAIRAFTAPEVVILGGIDKGADFTELAQVIKDAPNVKQLIIIGKIRHKLADVLRQNGVTQPVQVTDVQTMREIVGLARQAAAPGDVVILSPACASFDMFKNFYDRGDQFRSVVQGL